MIGLFVLGVLFVVFLMWIILSIILYKFINITLIENNKKKLPKYIGFPLSAFIVVFIASYFTFGWGWFVPYNLQPSYHKFKETCKLDPDIYQANGGKIDEEYYNKVLAYFDTNFEEVLQGNTGLARKGNSFNKEINIYHFGSVIKSDRQEIILLLDIEKNKITNEILPLKKVFFL